MKSILRYMLIPAVAGLVSSCAWDDKTTPGYEFMPDMYRSPSYETYGENPLYADSMASRMPVPGTVARGNDIFSDYDRLPYPFGNTPEGYEEAGVKLKNPFEVTPQAIEEGKVLYADYCTPCHGETGDGNGLVVQRNGPRPPAFNSDLLKDLPVGKMYHTIHWGKNMMGSHASQVTPTQRWKIIMYIQKLQKPAAEQSADASNTTS
jgi:mono/diheme cytochrome c family protein